MGKLTQLSFENFRGKTTLNFWERNTLNQKIDENKQTTEIEKILDYFLLSESPNDKIYNICYTLINHKNIVTGYMDLTERFP